MKERELATSVAIVGAGPVGLSLAIDLAWRGIDSLVIEKESGHVTHPRAGFISVRTMEFFRRWGIARAVRESGFPDDFALSIEFCTSLSGHTLARDEYPSIGAMPLPHWSPEKKQRCPQHWLDPVLKMALRDSRHGKLLVDTAVESFEQDGSGVRLRAKNTRLGHSLTIHADYLVGCDGANSTIRSGLGISMEGKGHLNYSMSVLFSCPDLLRQCGKEAAERFLLIGPEGTWGNVTVIDGREVWRLTVYGSASKFDLDSFDARAWVLRALGTDQIDFEIISILPWKRAELIAECYGIDRVLLAGDSVHTMSPTGGMGMNTGLGDVFDLGWKLQATLEGWGGPKLLASYTEERKPVAIRNAAYSTHNYKTWVSPRRCEYLLEDSKRAEAARREIGENMKRATQYEWQSWGLQMGYRYEGSPICEPDGTPPTPDDYSAYVPTARPGSRAPHIWLAPGHSIIDLFGKGFTLLVFDQAAIEQAQSFTRAAAQRGVPLIVRQIGEPGAAELYETPLVLVRPDGHVAWRGADAESAGDVIDTVRGAH
ncbi:MAG: FAD-dependent monooxygenase [Pigmentiphaga sp.]|uniref:FAD-dependent monooxygenase n=1 Tax=Pigmentiphaga sp. TaxID=1977564 RepID=UPI0029BC5B66|nr:FAD-dependent monooxygenase [Pigmentiphaga sp.]MDX3907793.1 FAD-dependent monooxygenase [Pigmentiphaga sp.]